MNSHDIRTPPHATEEILNHPNYAWIDHITEFYPSNRHHILDFDRISFEIPLVKGGELDANNLGEVDFDTYKVVDPFSSGQ